MKLITFLIAVSSVVLLSGCGDSPLSTSGMEDYFPMELGDWWFYDYYAVQTEPDSMLWEEGSYFDIVISVSEDTFLVARTASFWVSSGQPRPDTLVALDTLTYIINPDSVVLYLSPGSTAYRELDFPLLLNKTWGDYTVTDMHVDLSVPEGFYEDCACIGWYYEVILSTIYTYYCPDVGIVAKYIYDADMIGSGIFLRDYIFELSSSSRID
ncbi:MAG: hypothetical protein K8S15_02555 [Candidatus Aegiribacteria sp.]|nr:hypothetical protein [Candidatus Aegiribacteria sp.]